MSRPTYGQEVHVSPADRALDDDEWRRFVDGQRFGHLVAAGRDRPVPVVVPTQFVLDGDEVLVHLVATNPLLAAVAERPTVLLSVAGDWAFVPSDWKVVGDEDPRLGIPTTYYAAAQLVGEATVVEGAELAALLRRQLAVLQPGVDVVDPAERPEKLRAIRGLRVAVTEVRAKFKFGGNVDEEHRWAVVERLRERDGPGDAAAAAHTLRRTGAARPG